MHFESVSIQNFRGIEELALSFAPGVNLLIGENGAGKTSILEALSVALGAYLAGVPQIVASGFQQEDFRCRVEQVSSASSHAEYFSPKVEMTISANGTSMTAIRTREDRSGNGKTKTTGKEIANYAQKITNLREANLPVLSYMGISRVISAKRADFGKGKRNQINDRRCGYIGCLDSLIDKNSILEWVKKMSYMQTLEGKKVAELTLFHQIVAAFMKQMNDLEETPTVVYSAAFDGLAYLEQKDLQPISQLSAGYQSLLWMAMELAFRLAQLNPEMKDPQQATGIVLIDEVDMHLHPRWQWKVVPTLSSVFPNIQFIIATHSPIIISSCKQANLIRISELKEVDHPADAYAYSVRDVVELIQGSNGIPEELQKLSSQFDEALNQENYEKAKELLEEMRAEYGSDNTEVKTAELELMLETDEG
jgi:predicted ATP-binding protein involved in virulence